MRAGNQKSKKNLGENSVKGNENLWEQLGWAGAGLVICGYCLNANQLVSCWPVWIFGNGVIAVYSYRKEAYSTMAMSMIILALNIYGWISWS